MSHLLRDFFLGALVKGAGTQKRVRMHTERWPTQVGRRPAQAGRKLTQVRKEPVQTKRGDVPRVRT